VANIFSASMPCTNTT